VRSAHRSKPSRRDCVRIGVFAGGIDERTIRDFFTGRRRTHPQVVQSIRSAMAQLGIPDPTLEAQGGVS